MAKPSRVEYRELVAEVRACVRAHVPPGAVVLVASKGDEELVRIEGYRAWHFPRDEWGGYAGHHPASSIDAIAHLRHLYAQGARYLVFPATSAWWLQHYRELANLLDSAHRLVTSQERVAIVYELLHSPAFDASTAPTASADERARRIRASEIVSLAMPRAPRPLRILTILARFGTDQYARAEQELADLFARQMPGIEHRVIVVDNALPRVFVEAREDRVLIGGDNSSREFSAFDRAVAFAGPNIWSYDFLHFATSAFNTLYVAYLERFEPALLEAVAGRAVCVGHIDCYNEPVDVGMHRAQHWVRSCFFLLPPAEAMALGSFVSVADGARYFTGEPHEPFLPDAPISRRYRDYITTWLTGDGVGQGVKWHSTFTLTRETMPVFEQKARAILNEQLLSIRLQALGCRLADVTWLSAMARRQDRQQIRLSTPWREQLANRDRDALHLGRPRHTA